MVDQQLDTAGPSMRAPDMTPPGLRGVIRQVFLYVAGSASCWKLPGKRSLANKSDQDANQVWRSIFDSGEWPMLIWLWGLQDLPGLSSSTTALSSSWAKRLLSRGMLH